MTSPPRDQRTGWLDELLQIEEEVRLELVPLSEAQFAWRPGPGRWSIAECLEHLGVTTGLAVQGIRGALERGRAAGRTGSPPFKFGLLGGWFVGAMERPGKRGMTAPVNFVPRAGTPKPAVLECFSRAQRELQAALESAEGLALDKIKAGSAAKGAGWLQLNVAAWFAATLAHERRHVGQARRVMQAAGFPG